MAALTFPPNPTRLNYVVTPWTDPDGSKWIWSQGKLSWSPESVPAYLSITAVPISGATPTPAITFIGQLAIVSHTGGTYTEWGAVSLTQWLPRTAGILKHASGPWYRASLAADGTAQYDLLPNQ